MSTLARLERAHPGATLQHAAAALGAVGMALVVIDNDGTAWEEDHGLGIDLDDVTDDGGRRFPAHLYARVRDHEPGWRAYRREMRGLARGTVPVYQRTWLSYMRPATQRHIDLVLGIDPDHRSRR